ncbi:hypothetical protein [Segatella sp.]|uniref:hypothetical protein n=1 Tax=Segatella sp. TaxID=2974253 RepID=UPI003AB396C3
MFVDIKLYMTTIDEENLFVGSSQENRELSLNSLRVQTEIIKAPFNPTDPFRLEGNYLEYQRKYNYARFKYYVNSDDTEPSVTRYYFIRDFEYVNDMVCRMVCDEDLVSNIFWQLKFARFYPSMCTYNSNKLTANGRKYKAIDAGQIYEIEEEYNLLKYFQSSGLPTLAVGFIIFTATYQRDEGDGFAYIEGNTTYPLRNYVLPFIYDPLTGSVREDFKIFAVSGDRVLDVFDLGKFLNQTTAGFDIVSSMIYMNLKNEINITVTKYEDYYGAKISGIDDNFLRQMTLGDLGNAMVIKKLPDAFETFIENLPVDMYSVPEYRKLNIFNGGNVYEYDTRQIVPFGGVSRITYKQSFIPPYRTTLYFNEERIQYTPNNFISFNNDTTFMDFSSAYADWYRQNYNSQIMGLKVKQETERENLGVRTAAGLANTVVGIGATLAGGQISAALNKNAAAPALAGVNAAKQATDFATNTISNYLTLNNNQAKERKLQEFQIQDLKNTPSEVSFGSSIVPFIVNKMYMRVVVFKNIFYDEIVKYHKAYGFESMIDISDSFQQHTLFDYYRADDTVLNTDEVFLDEMERSQVEDTFSKGVRVWYDYNNMKNFTIENPEKAV